MTMEHKRPVNAPADVEQPDPSPGLPISLPRIQLQRLPRPGGPAIRPNTRTWIKRALWAAVATALAVALTLGLRPKPVRVETAPAHSGTLVVTVAEDGRTRVKDRYLISAPLAGTVSRMTLEPGDSIQRGAVVARLLPSAPPLLDPRSRAEAEARVAAARAAVSQAGSAIERARVAVGFAEREAARQRALLQEGATAPQIAEQAELAERMRREDLASAEFAGRVAASELRLARVALTRLDARSGDAMLIRSPVAGQVLRVLQESEAAVQPGTPLVEVGDPRALEVVVDVLTTDAVHIRPGAPVRIERWGGDSTLGGHVHQVEPAAFTRLSALGVEEQRVNVVIDLEVPPDRAASLGDGYRVEASIVVWVGRDRLLVPGGAVFRQGEGWATYVVQDGRTRLRTVEPGRRNAAEVEVLKGLRPGERVVLYPTDAVRDGARAEAQ
jgi:HlyD family secretion protein